jgi:hypothetical protein
MKEKAGLARSGRKNIVSPMTLDGVRTIQAGGAEYLPPGPYAAGQYYGAGTWLKAYLHYRIIVKIISGLIVLMRR